MSIETVANCTIRLGIHSPEERILKLNVRTYRLPVGRIERGGDIEGGYDGYE